MKNCRLSKLQALVADKIKEVQITAFVFETIENIVGKRENAFLHVE